MPYTTPPNSRAPGGIISSADDNILANNQIHMFTDTIRLAYQNAELSLTNSAQDVPNASITCDKDGQWIVIGCVMAKTLSSASAGGNFELSLDVGGTPESRTQQLTMQVPSALNWTHLIGIWKVTISGSTTVKLQGSHSGTVTGRSFTSSATTNSTVGILAWLQEAA